MSERNKAAVRTVFEVWSTGDLDRLDALVAPGVVHHDRYDPHAAHGLDGMKRSIVANRTAFPDLTLTVEDQVAEGDTVATRWTGTMTHAGRSATITGITIDRFEHGRIVEAWRSIDMLGLQRAIGTSLDG